MRNCIHNYINSKKNIKRLLHVYLRRPCHHMHWHGLHKGCITNWTPYLNIAYIHTENVYGCQILTLISLVVVIS